MVRAVVLVGVSRAGNLETLQAVHDGVRAMRKWAAGQGIDPELIKAVTDEEGPVEVSEVKKAVRELVNLTTVEQLVVYFAGHGVNLSLSEYWLLSGAPEDSNAAVNLAGSVELARFCGIPHVVIISDACRTAAEGIQAQAIRGSEIFPNIPEGTAERPVDVFFACALGAPSMELKDPKRAAAGYRAIYTDSLVQALEGLSDVVVEDPEEQTRLRLIEEAPDEPAQGLIRPWPLSFHLRADVAQRLESAGVKPGLSQTPVARINSRGTWLSRVPAPQKRPARAGTAGADREADAAGAGLDLSAASAAAESAPGHRTLLEVSHSMLRSTLAENRILATSPPPGVANAEPSAAGLQDSISRIFEPFGPARLDTSCGFKVRGARLASALSRGGQVEVGDAQRHTALVKALSGPAANVLLEFEQGTGMVLPAVADYVGSITVEDGEVVNVTYEPARSSPLWDGVADRLDELRSLRAFIASSARMGVFRVRGGDAEQLAERMRTGNGLDPTMALYAAYACHDRQQTDQIRQMSRALRAALSVRFFDLELLSGELMRRSAGKEPGLFPFVPLLARGWPLLKAHRVTLPPGLERLAEHRVDALWTHFDRRGVELIRSAIHDKEVP